MVKFSIEQMSNLAISPEYILRVHWGKELVKQHIKDGHADELTYIASDVLFEEPVQQAAKKGLEKVLLTKIDTYVKQGKLDSILAISKSTDISPKIIDAATEGISKINQNKIMQYLSKGNAIDASNFSQTDMKSAVATLINNRLDSVASTYLISNSSIQPMSAYLSYASGTNEYIARILKNSGLGEKITEQICLDTALTCKKKEQSSQLFIIAFSDAFSDSIRKLALNVAIDWAQRCITNCITVRDYSGLISMSQNQSLTSDLRNTAKKAIDGSVMNAIETFVKLGDYPGLIALSKNESLSPDVRGLALMYAKDTKTIPKNKETFFDLLFLASNKRESMEIRELAGTKLSELANVPISDVKNMLAVADSQTQPKPDKFIDDGNLTFIYDRFYGDILITQMISRDTFDAAIALRPDLLEQVCKDAIDLCVKHNGLTVLKQIASEKRFSSYLRSLAAIASDLLKTAESKQSRLPLPSNLRNQASTANLPAKKDGRLKQ